jgi:hypothetical protein
MLVIMVAQALGITAARADSKQKWHERRKRR